MNCPNDGTNLLMTSRENIEIDYCPQCRGVWLDRAELDRLIERSERAVTTPPPQMTREPVRDEAYKHNDNELDERTHYQPHHKKRREPFIGDIFDF